MHPKHVPANVSCARRQDWLPHGTLRTLDVYGARMVKSRACVVPGRGWVGSGQVQQSLSSVRVILEAHHIFEVAELVDDRARLRVARTTPGSTPERWA